MTCCSSTAVLARQGSPRPVRNYYERGRDCSLISTRLAQRVKRVATGWEPQFTIAVDGIIDKLTVMELCEQFYA